MPLQYFWLLITKVVECVCFVNCFYKNLSFCCSDWPHLSWSSSCCPGWLIGCSCWTCSELRWFYPAWNWVVWSCSFWGLTRSVGFWTTDSFGMETLSCCYWKYEYLGSFWLDRYLPDDIFGQNLLHWRIQYLDYLCNSKFCDNFFEDFLNHVF